MPRSTASSPGPPIPPEAPAPETPAPLSLPGAAAWFTPIRSVAFTGWAERMEAIGIPYPKRAYERFEARRAERDRT